MSIIQTAIGKLIEPQLAPLRQQIAELQQRPALSEADRTSLDKAAALVAELEGLAGGTIPVAPTSTGDLPALPTLPGA